MRLVRAVERLEAGAAAAAEPGAIGMVWTEGDVRIDARELERGQYVAVDLRLGELRGGIQTAQSLERATYDERDLGWVYEGDAKEPCGRVISVDGTLLSWCRRGPECEDADCRHCPGGRR